MKNCWSATQNWSAASKNAKKPFAPSGTVKWMPCWFRAATAIRFTRFRGADEAYRVMVQEMAEGALTLTAEGLILFSNEQFAAMLRMPLERVIGTRIQDLVAREDAPTVSALLHAKDGRKAEVKLKAMAGRRTGAGIPRGAECGAG